MKRANVTDLRKSMETANIMKNVGILFVCVPVLNEEDHIELIESVNVRLEQMAVDAENHNKTAQNIE